MAGLRLELKIKQFWNYARWQIFFCCFCGCMIDDSFLKTWNPVMKQLCNGSLISSFFGWVTWQNHIMPNFLQRFPCICFTLEINSFLWVACVSSNNMFALVELPNQSGTCHRGRCTYDSNLWKKWRKSKPCRQTSKNRRRQSVSGNFGKGHVTSIAKKQRSQCCKEYEMSLDGCRTGMTLN